MSTWQVFLKSAFGSLALNMSELREFLDARLEMVESRAGKEAIFEEDGVRSRTVKEVADAIATLPHDAVSALIDGVVVEVAGVAGTVEIRVRLIGVGDPLAVILDVEDKARLRAHFARMADLSQDIGCYALDYRRDYAELPRVQQAILDNCRAQQ